MTLGRFKFVLWTTDEQDVDFCFAQLKKMYEKYSWSYYHVNLEHCPTTGKEHLDGYYEYPTQRKVSTERNKFTKMFRKGFGDLQHAKGSAGENDDYSEKEGGRRETAGKPGKGQGTRNDLERKKDQIMAGEITVDEITIEEPEQYHQYGRTLHRIEDLALRKKFRTEMTQGEWYWGPTGVGKSHIAFEGYTPETHYIWKNDNGWQDGYSGQETVIINDFRGEIKYNELLQMVDKWPYHVPRRCREPAPFLAKKVIITSSLEPAQVYHHRVEEDKIDQLLRRFKIFHLSAPGF